MHEDLTTSRERWVLLETAPWGHRMRLPGHHLARWLTTRGHKVAYVSVPVSPWHFLRRQARELAGKRWKQEGAWGQWRTPDLFCYIPRTLLPIHDGFPFRSEFAWRNSIALTFPKTGRVLEKAGFAQPDVLLLQNPLLAGVMDVVTPRLVVARVEDALDKFPGFPKSALRHLPEIYGRARLVTTTASSLDDWARERGAQEVFSLGNGVDAFAFRRPAELPPRPSDLPEDGSPIAIYVGALDAWFDEALLVAAARRLPHWRFVLIGPPREPLEALRAMPNVRFLGPRDQSLVPAYLWHARAGIIPFLRTPLIESVAPLKLFEYVAAGLPVVATRWTELERIGSPARLTDDADGFVAALGDIEAGRLRGNAGPGWVGSHDWDFLFSRFHDRIRALLEEARAAE